MKLSKELKQDIINYFGINPDRRTRDFKYLMNNYGGYELIIQVLTEIIKEIKPVEVKPKPVEVKPKPVEVKPKPETQEEEIILNDNKKYIDIKELLNNKLLNLLVENNKITYKYFMKSLKNSKKEYIKNIDNEEYKKRMLINAENKLNLCYKFEYERYYNLYDDFKINNDKNDIFYIILDKYFNCDEYIFLTNENYIIDIEILELYKTNVINWNYL